MEKRKTFHGRQVGKKRLLPIVFPLFLFLLIPLNGYGDDTRKNSEKPTAESLTHNQTILHHFSTAHQKNPPQKIRIQTSGSSLPETKKDDRSTCIHTKCK